MFEDRENAFEAKYAHDQEMRFKMIARRNKQLGIWAGLLLGKENQDAEAYALEVVKSDFEEAGDDDVLRKVSGDLSSTDTTKSDVRAKMDSLLQELMDAEE